MNLMYMTLFQKKNNNTDRNMVNNTCKPLFTRQDIKKKIKNEIFSPLLWPNQTAELIRPSKTNCITFSFDISFDIILIYMYMWSWLHANKQRVFIRMRFWQKNEQKKKTSENVLKNNMICQNCTSYFGDFLTPESNWVYKTLTTGY